MTTRQAGSIWFYRRSVPFGSYTSYKGQPKPKIIRLILLVQQQWAGQVLIRWTGQIVSNLLIALT